MPRGVPSRNAQLQRLLAKAQAHAGVELSIPDENSSDLLAEAQAVVDYLDDSSDFKDKICANCGDPFKYRWTRDAISTCSVECMRGLLLKKGLKWDPTRSQTDRWGHPVPQVIPAAALKVLEEHYGNSEAPTGELQGTLF